MLDKSEESSQTNSGYPAMFDSLSPDKSQEYVGFRRVDIKTQQNWHTIEAPALIRDTFTSKTIARKHD